MKIASLLVLTLCAMLNFSPAAAAETRLVRFGLITDTHVSDKRDQADTATLNASARYFSGGTAKIGEFAETMNASGAAFVAELGDFTDNPADAKLAYPQRKAAVVDFVTRAEAELARFKGPRYHVFGNHDTDQMSKQEYLSHLANTGIAADASYYGFEQGGVRFLVLDASFKANGESYSGVPGTAGAGYRWQDANVPTAELAWLQRELETSRLPVIVLTHQFLNPAEQLDPLFDPAHSVRNAAEVRSALEKSGKVLAVFSGHYHDGGYQSVKGIHYIGLQASAAYGKDTSYHNQYATVEVRREGARYQISVVGHGQQKSHVLERSL